MADDSIHVTLAKFGKDITYIKEKVDRLVNLNDIQNGHIASLLRWRSYVVGAVSVLIILAVPIVLSLAKTALAKL